MKLSILTNGAGNAIIESSGTVPTHTIVTDMNCEGLACLIGGVGLALEATEALGTESDVDGAESSPLTFGLSEAL